jgi:FAD/FMN-containing dehydrogenase
MLESWGRYPKSKPSKVHNFWWLTDGLPHTNYPLLPHGQGRSYGDVCLNSGGTLVSTRLLNRFINFNKDTGVLRCEAGTTVADILKFSVPLGWFIPVTPGTKFVSIGGAIANDVHGKNHHIEGTIGRHILQFELLRSSGERLICSPSSNVELFKATIGGLGLTGLITWADIALRPVKGPYIQEESIKFQNLSEFFEISRSTDSKVEYTVAWLDCVASGANLGRGIFMRGDHSQRPAKRGDYYRESKLSVPFDLPNWALNNLSVSAFNFLYFNKQQTKVLNHTTHYEPFFYPLDAVRGWNKIYGKQGFLQFQCVVPFGNGSGEKAIQEILKAIVADGSASFLAVLKEFGDIPSPGMLSFPRAGITLCLDFAFRGERTMKLFKNLHSIVFANGGAIYPAKDACMTPEEFRMSFPAISDFTQHIDPAFSSEFWRRVGGGSL